MGVDNSDQRKSEPRCKLGVGAVNEQGEFGEWGFDSVLEPWKTRDVMRHHSEEQPEHA